MFWIWFRNLKTKLSRATWGFIVLIQLAIFSLGAFLIPLFEKVDSPFQFFGNYAWWYIVTTATVGYGDIAPVSAGGRIVASIIIILGIGTLGVTLGKMAEKFLEIGRRKMKGLDKFNESNHVVIFGYRAGDTEQMVREILGDEKVSKKTIVLCSSRTDENPIPEHVKFVKGEFSTDDVLRRACVDKAEAIIVYGHDDNQTIFAAITASYANQKAHIVAYVQNPENAIHLRRLNSRIECVTPVIVPMIVQAMENPSSTKVVEALTSKLVDDQICRLNVPKSFEGRDYGDLLSIFKKVYDTTLIAVGASHDFLTKIDLNPPVDHFVSGGTALFYVAKKPIEIEWKLL